MVNTTATEAGAMNNNSSSNKLPLPLPLVSLNHVSLVCRSLESSLAFYRNVLGFVPIRRPGSFGFDGAWLFNFGIGVHLLQAEDPANMPAKKAEINPKDNHISFTCESMETVQRRLKEMGIRYVQRRVEEGGIYVDQLFFHDPDGFMIEVCTCDNLPVIPLLDAPQHAVCKRALAAPPAVAVPQPDPSSPAPAPVPSPLPQHCVAEVVVVDVANGNMSAMTAMACPEA